MNEVSKLSKFSMSQCNTGKRDTGTPDTGRAAAVVTQGSHYL